MDAITGAGGHASIVTSCGHTIQAQRVIIAMPPPLWNHIKFTPELPAQKQDLASRMFMGTAVKAVALYEEAFWKDLEPTGKPTSLYCTCRYVHFLFQIANNSAPTSCKVTLQPLSIHIV